MLIETKTIKTEYSCIVSSEHLKMYLKCMEYIPAHWGLENILNKKASLLTKEEIELLKFVQEENKYKEIIKDIISKNENEKNITINEDIFKYKEKMTIDKYAFIKLTEEEKDYCENVISNCITLEDVEEYIDFLKNRKNINVPNKYILIDEYIMYELEKKQLRMQVNNMNSDINENIKENRRKELHGYEKCINTRNRF